MEPKSFISRLLECAFLFLLSIILIRMGIDILTEIWPALAIIAVIILGLIIAWRVYRHWRDTGQW